MESQLKVKRKLPIGTRWSSHYVSQSEADSRDIEVAELGAFRVERYVDVPDREGSTQNRFNLETASISKPLQPFRLLSFVARSKELKSEWLEGSAARS
jgi:hypothetical protein